MFSKKYHIAVIIVLVICNIFLLMDNQRRIKREKILTAQLKEHEKFNAEYFETALISNILHPAIKNNKNKISLFYFLNRSNYPKAFRAEVYFLKEMTRRYPGKVEIYFEGVKPDTLTFTYKNDFEIIDWMKKRINLNCSFAVIKDKNNDLLHTYLINPADRQKFSQNLNSIALTLNAVYDN